jgi:hypothetical protein
MTVDRAWTPVDVDAILHGLATGTITGPVPSLLPRSDGVCLLYPGEVHSMAGEPEAGKGWIVQAETARVLPTAKVLYLDFEDTAASVLGRLLALGATADQIVANLVYVRPDTPPGSQTIPGLLKRGPFELSVIDGLSEAYVLAGLDPYSNVDAAKFLAAIARPIADHGAAVVGIDHVVKAAESRGRYAIGAQHKLAGIAVAYNIEATKQPSRLTAGLLKIKVAKDRHGHVRGHADSSGTIALVHVTPTDDGQVVTVAVEPPDASTPDGAFRPTFLMGRIAELVDREPGIGTRAIRERIKGQHRAKDTALALLISEGYIERSEHGAAHHHRTLRPFAADPDEQAPCPDRAPATVPSVPDRAPAVPQACPQPLHETVPPSPPIGGRGTRHTDPLDAELERVTAKFGGQG